jgi:hypothetical protein
MYDIYTTRPYRKYFVNDGTLEIKYCIEISIFRLVEQWLCEFLFTKLKKNVSAFHIFKFINNFHFSFGKNVRVKLVGNHVFTIIAHI